MQQFDSEGLLKQYSELTAPETACLFRLRLSELFRTGADFSALCNVSTTSCGLCGLPSDFPYVGTSKVIAGGSLDLVSSLQGVSTKTESCTSSAFGTTNSKRVADHVDRCNLRPPLDQR